MLKLKGITKNYVVGEDKVEALKGIDVEFRKNEFVAILGPSGCGKTTLLNIIGGLDHYTSGDLVINNKSTKNYSDYDWDTYRNHSIGFVFQSYNLIPHQTVLSNVELALTLSGASKAVRKERAIEALKKVGLEDQINKKPNQLSGGQMQRVAIARAIVNDPEIILADEPTGALDTKTSLQVMEILKEIAKDRLVIMVTHNPSLADEYASRIVKLLDGKMIDDNNPYHDDIKVEAKTETTKKTKTKLKKHSSMSFLTALSLSINNMLTKKGRTILTAFAGSIGIIGIALILSLSSGFQNYIDDVQKDTLSTYPITIEATSVDYTEMMQGMMGQNSDSDHELDAVYEKSALSSMLEAMLKGVKENDLKSFKKYLDSNEKINDYVSAVQYTYNAKLNIYKNDYTETTNRRLIPLSFNFGSMGSGSSTTDMFSNNMVVWQEMLDNKDLLNSQYELVTEDSKWPTSKNEVVVVVDKNNEISDYLLYALGLKSEEEFTELMYNLAVNPNYEVTTSKYSFSDVLGLTYKLVCDTDYYQLQADGLYHDMSKDASFMKSVLDNALEMKVVGIVRGKEGASATSISGVVGYSRELTDYIVNHNNASDPSNPNVLQAQIASETKNVITGEEFSKIGTTDYDNALSALGYATLDDPASISLYPVSFEAKEKIEELIKEYNSGKTKEEQIQYTDYVGIMMSSINTIIDAVTYVLIAFVAISLVVSSIMIGIITYISVLERTKEIGILRSIGARKKDISRVFNAETLIIGFFSGLMGVLIAALIDIPINIIINSFANIGTVAELPILGAVILVAISMALTFISGLIPSSYAAKKDPVIALRTE